MPNILFCLQSGAHCVASVERMLGLKISMRNSWHLQFSAFLPFLLSLHFVVNLLPKPLRSACRLLGHLFSLPLFLFVGVSLSPPLMRTSKPSFSSLFLFF